MYFSPVKEEERYRIPLVSILQQKGVLGFMVGIKSGLGLDQFLGEHREGSRRGCGQKSFRDSTFARRLSGIGYCMRCSAG